MVAYSRLAILGVAICLVPMLLQTFTNTLRQWPLLVLLFLLTLLAALPSALAFYSTVTTEADASMALMQLLPDFSYTVFSDFMHEHGAAIWPLLRVGCWTALLSVLVSVWAKGGILYSFSNGFRAVTFWQAATYYFSRNLRLLGVTVLFVGIWLVVLTITGILLTLILSEVLDDPFSERGYVAIALVVGLIFGLMMVRILCTSQYASVLLYQHDETVAFRAFTQSWRFIRQHRVATFGRYLVLILIGTGLLSVYLLLESGFQARNWWLIGMLFLLQQALVFSRTALAVWSLRIAFVNAQSLPPVVRQSPKPQYGGPAILPPADAAGADDILPVH
nr:hypothetical protein A6C57_13570 [Fibrella sp. ES10-3-2-2]